MLGKGRYAVVRKWKNVRVGDAIQVIEYAETVKEAEEFIRKQEKDVTFDWDVMEYTTGYRIDKNGNIVKR